MTGISHKLAQRYLRMELDGLLSAAQRADLETHLRDCEACRADAESFSSLTTRLHTEFHARWDDIDGPSKQALANVRSQTRRIMMQRRFDFVFNILGSAAALLVLFFVVSSVAAQLQKKSAAGTEVQATTPAPLSQGKLIAFVSKQTGNNDIYTMNSDGSDVKNLTNNPADDNFPVWSPDGTKIAFISDRDGNENIYVMNFDGSGLTRITDDTGQDTNPLWSPDGTKIAYQSGTYSDPINTNIYVVNADGQNKKRLTNYLPNTTVWPNTWSPDSQFILFEVNKQIVQISLQDDTLTPLTSPAEYDISISSKFILSANGSKLIYFSECDQKERGSSDFCQTVNSINRYSSTSEPQGTLRIQNVCEIKDTSKTHTYFGRALWSPDRTKIIFAFLCEGQGGFFYIANADGSDFKSLTNAPLLNMTTNFDWSYDSQSLIFASAPNDSTQENLYTLNINAALANPNIHPTPLNTSARQVSWLYWQPMPTTELVKVNPTPEPTQTVAYNGLIAFTSEKTGNPDIYIMKPDGSNLTDLTNNPAQDINPYWSPDGKRIAFMSDRDGSGLMNIYVMNVDGSSLTKVTDNKQSTANAHHEFGVSDQSPWSPNGSKLLFTEWSPDSQTYKLYAIDADGQNKILLARLTEAYSYPSWSPDGQHIAYVISEQINDRQVARIHVVDVNGQNDTNITSQLAQDEDLASWNYSWTLQGNIRFVANRIYSESGTQYTFYEATTDGGTLAEITHTSTGPGDYWDGTTFISSSTTLTLTWLRSDATFSEFKPFEKCQTGTDIPYNGFYKRSSRGYILFGAGCPNGDWWLTFANPQGTSVQPLLNYPLSSQKGISNMVWSSDDQYMAINAPSPNQTYLYVVNMAAALKDPSTQPVKVLISNKDLYYNISWQSQ